MSEARSQPPAVAPLRRVGAIVASNALLIGVVSLVLVFTALNPAFLTFDNFRNISIQASVIAVVAVPTACLLISGKVDLSIGSTVALGAVTTGLLITHGVPLVPAVLGGIASGAVIGFVNGALVTAWELSPIIVTLGALVGVRGIALTLSPDPLFGFGSAFVSLGESDVLGIPYLALVAIAVLGVGGIVLAKMPVGQIGRAHV